MILTIIIPAYNEEETIEDIILKVLAVKFPNQIKMQILVINDASTDKTMAKVKNIKIKNNIKNLKLISHSVNMGKGQAIKTGLKSAAGEIILIQDADLEYDPEYLPRLIKPILLNKASVVYGTRLKNYPLRLTGVKRTPLISHYIANKLLSLITSLLYGKSVTDMETGYKVFTKEVLKNINLNSNRFDIEPEITAKVLKKGYKIFEVPIKTIPRGYNEGKKITWKDGFVALWTLVKYRFID